jgi:hypothetical protein
MRVRVANGQLVSSDQEVKGFEWWIQAWNFVAYDLILGMDLLKQYSPMTCDWLRKWIQFDYEGTRITLQGIIPIDTTSVPDIYGEQLHKLAKGNDIWALVAILSAHPNDTKQEECLVNGIPADMSQAIFSSLTDAASLHFAKDALILLLSCPICIPTKQRFD